MSLPASNGDGLEGRHRRPGDNRAHAGEGSEPAPSPRPHAPAPAPFRPWVLAALAAVYFIAGKAGLALALVHANASAVWPSTGIALAAMLLFGRRYWPGIFIGAFLVNATTYGSIATSLGIAIGNTLEALAGAYLVNRFANGRRMLDTARDTFRFAILAGTIATVVSATLGVTSLAAGGFASWSDFGSIWLTWWLGDMSGALIVTPVLLWSGPPQARWTGARIAEAVLLFALIVLVGSIIFGGAMPLRVHGYSLKYVCMPLLIWAAFRFDPRTAAAANLILATVAVWETFRWAASPERQVLNESLLLLQVFLGVAAITTLAMAVEVSARRRAEQAARAATAELREAMAELETFSHSISHDLRSPIGAVLNCVEMLEEDHRDRLDGDGHRLVRRIRKSGESSVRLLDQLLQFASVGREVCERSPVDMTPLARDAFAQVASGDEDGSNVRLVVDELPPARGSAALLGRVFYNLFSNAVKYTRGRANRHVEVFARAGDRENTYFVADNGIGFDPRLANELFVPFRRLQGAQSFEGSGLGLAIVAKIVRRHGGRIWAESDGSRGARFSFTLPHRDSD